MNARILLVLVVLVSVSSASALQIIGAIDDDPSAYDEYALDQILDAARLQFGDEVVSSYVRSLDEITDDDLDGNIVLLLKDGRLLISVPEDSEIALYLEELEDYAGDYLPFDVIDSSDVIDTGIDDQFDESCVESDAGIYESGTASGRMEEGSVVADYEDLCLGDRLVEYSCDGDFVASQQYDCAGGCSNGACLDQVVEEDEEENETEPVDETPVVLPGEEDECCWIWWGYGYVRADPENPSEPAEDPEPDDAQTCGGCMVGDRCVENGFVLPDNRTCRGGIVVCTGCATIDGCYLEGAQVGDQLCEDGDLVTVEVSEPDPEPVVEDEPQGIFARIFAFFRRLFSFGRG